jgi:alkylated DNA repair dioxygenase AlkB
MVQSLMAESAVGQSLKGDARKIRKEMEIDTASDEDRQAALAERGDLDTARRGEVEREKRMAQIEGEPAQQRNTRLQNQAWNPDAYGDDYRSSFKKPAEAPEVGDVEAENRRRRRLQMAMSSPYGE